MKFTLVALATIIGLVAASPVALPNPVPFYESEPAEYAHLDKRDCSACNSHIICCAFPLNVNYCYKC